MRVVYTGGEGEITEKKSRFIATVKPVQSEEEAVAFINETKKKYWDARHNCSAFVITLFWRCAAWNRRACTRLSGSHTGWTCSQPAHRKM